MCFGAGAEDGSNPDRVSSLASIESSSRNSRSSHSIRLRCPSPTSGPSSATRIADPWVGWFLKPFLPSSLGRPHLQRTNQLRRNSYFPLSSLFSACSSVIFRGPRRFLPLRGAESSSKDGDKLEAIKSCGLLSLKPRGVGDRGRENVRAIARGAACSELAL